MWPVLRYIQTIHTAKEFWAFQISKQGLFMSINLYRVKFSVVYYLLFPLKQIIFNNHSPIVHSAWMRLSLTSLQLHSFYTTPGYFYILIPESFGSPAIGYSTSNQIPCSSLNNQALTTRKSYLHTEPLSKAMLRKFSNIYIFIYFQKSKKMFKKKAQAVICRVSAHAFQKIQTQNIMCDFNPKIDIL